MINTGDEHGGRALVLSRGVGQPTPHDLLGCSVCALSTAGIPNSRDPYHTLKSINFDFSHGKKFFEYSI